MKKWWRKLLITAFVILAVGLITTGAIVWVYRLWALFALGAASEAIINHL